MSRSGKIKIENFQSDFDIMGYPFVFVMTEELIYKGRYRIHTYEIDFRGQARLSSLLNYLQDVAGAQALQFGFSVETLFRLGLTWVLSRYHLKIERYPLFGEKIEIHTWPSGRSEFHALRDWEAYDDSGEKILAATSSWMIIDLKSKQPVSVDFLYKEKIILPRRALEDNFEPLPLLPSAEREVEFPVEMNHLDLNRHVNNVVYVQWALEAMPPEILWKEQAVEIEVSYKAEALYGHTVLSRVFRPQQEEKEFWHQIVHGQNGRELARLRTRWQTWKVQQNKNDNNNSSNGGRSA